MKRTALAATAIGLAASAAHAGGLDRSRTPIGLIFEQGTYAEFSYSFTMPNATGTDTIGNSYSDVGNNFSLVGVGFKHDVNEKLSFGIILDQPYDTDIAYNGSPATTLLGGTMAQASSYGLTALARYKFNDRISVYGGPRIVKADGMVTLSGLAYAGAGLNGYNVRFASDSALGYVVGAAYEIPEIAFRTALTYHSPIDLSFSTFETFPGAPGALSTGKTAAEVPQSVSLDFQTGIAKDTLLMGRIRWSEWEAFTLNPPSAVPNIAELDNVITYEIGVGRRFSEKFSASIMFRYEEEEGNDLVSPLKPSHGQSGVTLAGKYQINEKVSFSGGVQYLWLGDGLPEVGTPDTQVGTFTDNESISIGFKVGINLN